MHRSLVTTRKRALRAGLQREQDEEQAVTVTLQHHHPGTAAEPNSRQKHRARSSSSHHEQDAHAAAPGAKRARIASHAPGASALRGGAGGVDDASGLHASFSAAAPAVGSSSQQLAAMLRAQITVAAGGEQSTSAEGEDDEEDDEDNDVPDASSIVSVHMPSPARVRPSRRGTPALDRPAVVQHAAEAIASSASVASPLFLPSPALRRRRPRAAAAAAANDVRPAAAAAAAVSLLAPAAPRNVVAPAAPSVPSRASASAVPAVAAAPEPQSSSEDRHWVVMDNSYAAAARARQYAQENAHAMAERAARLAEKGGAKEPEPEVLESLRLERVMGVVRSIQIGGGVSTKKKKKTSKRGNNKAAFPLECYHNLVRTSLFGPDLFDSFSEPQTAHGVLLRVGHVTGLWLHIETHELGVERVFAPAASMKKESKGEAAKRSPPSAGRPVLAQSSLYVADALDDSPLPRLLPARSAQLGYSSGTTIAAAGSSGSSSSLGHDGVKGLRAHLRELERATRGMESLSEVADVEIDDAGSEAD